MAETSHARCVFCLTTWMRPCWAFEKSEVRAWAKSPSPAYLLLFTTSCHKFCALTTPGFHASESKYTMPAPMRSCRSSPVAKPTSASTSWAMTNPALNFAAFWKSALSQLAEKTTRLPKRKKSAGKNWGNTTSCRFPNLQAIACCSIWPWPLPIKDRKVFMKPSMSRPCWVWSKPAWVLPRSLHWPCPAQITPYWRAFLCLTPSSPGALD